ncbi:hypothetical protein KY284_000971 [Solanum tuberosum]|nr:hypothetical protein KY284_000971 [Solanum tuberosum]
MNDGCDHTSTNAPDPIRTPKLSVLGRENGVVRTGDGGVEDECDGRRHASVRVEARSVGGRLGRWEEGCNSDVKRAWARVVLGWVTPGKSSCCIPPFCRNLVVNGVVRTGDVDVEDGRDGRRHASVRVEVRSVEGRLGRWEEGGV